MGTPVLTNSRGRVRPRGGEREASAWLRAAKAKRRNRHNLVGTIIAPSN